jgi:hypothetical protein
VTSTGHHPDVTHNRLRRPILTTLLVLTIGASGTHIASAATTKDPSTTEANARSHAARPRRITFRGTFGPAALLTPVCDDASRCVYPLERTNSRWTGGLEGASISAGAGTPTGAGFVGTGVHVFTGTIKGCGTGSLVWTEALVSIDSVTSLGTWLLADGSTADGRQVQGGGTFTAVQQPDGSGVVDGVGRIRC